ncbi:MAG TPA: hypothetical protein VHA06_17875 [Candidatus Angelobacter sp.]|nr:hypothetical protein [Candidatus Angelobacter sp.]
MKEFFAGIGAWLHIQWNARTVTFNLRAEVEKLRMSLAAEKALSLVRLENLQKLNYLMRTTAIRLAPKSMHELMGGSNQSTGNVCYIHPETLRNVRGIDVLSDGQILTVGAEPHKTLIVVTTLMPRAGVIFAPMNHAFFNAQQLEDYSKNWRVW